MNFGAVSVFEYVTVGDDAIGFDEEAGDPSAAERGIDGGKDRVEVGAPGV